MPNLSINGALNKVYLRQKPKTKDFEDFSNQLENLKDSIEKGISLNESEENFKNLINDFLKESFYKRTNLINTKKRIDSAIYKTLDSNSPVQVLIEAKRPGSNEFPTEKNLNTKAMQEALLYFLRERILWKNIDLKHIVITNGFEWFLFDASEFQTHFYNDKKLLSRYDEFEVNPSLLFDKTSDFYKDIAAPFINKVKTQINYVYFDIRLLSERQKIGVYKLLSPEHLLRKFVCNDSNELNAPFYNELLYILGLEEIKNGQKTQICRLDNNQQPASFIENTISQVEDDITNKKLQFDIALSLTITWINRILFLKLLETQLINYHKGSNEYKFLNTDTIKDFDDLQQLFFKVLAVPVNDRKPANVAEKYHNVPYLNSSLFETADYEANYKISGLRNDELPIHKQTILRDSRNNKRLVGKLPVLEYLFRFLDAYDFGSEPNDDSLTRDTQKTLINASVLGLIFEKINGYKDGSYFTPGQITAFMCRETIRRAVVQKFNEAKGWKCKNFDELADKTIDKAEANKIINSLRICDPAVGSGHFLVSALNELIAIKADMQVLQLKNGKRLKYKVSVENDELMVYDDDGELFKYIPKNLESQLVQESLFEEKRTIIENCLFGVDINPNSVNICRLRLWIELLKNAYYKEDGEFETLPNIDINIKCGNSLVSYYPVQIGEPVGNNINLINEIAEYKTCVNTYKCENNKPEKQKVKEAIAKLKQKIAPGIQLSLELESQDVEANRKALKSNIYRNSMEWMIEFPEVLDDEGRFLGFDVVIGNPPYIGEKGHKSLFQIVKADTSLGKFYLGKMDYFYFFFHLSLNMLKNKNGICALITTNYYPTANGARKLRDDLKSRANFLQLINFNECKLFESALGQHNLITILEKKTGDNNLCKILNTSKKGYIKGKQIISILEATDESVTVDYVPQNEIYEGQNNYIRLTKSIQNAEPEIFSHIFQKLTINNDLLGNIANVNAGIMGGCDSLSEHNLSYVSKEYVLSNDLQINDGVFVLDNENDRDCSRIDEFAGTRILKDFYKNSDINKYVTQNTTSKRIIFSSASNSNADKRHIQSSLLLFKPILEEIRKINGEKLEDWYLLRRGAAHPQIFNSAKIVCPQRNTTNVFGYNDIEWYASADVYYITEPNPGYDLKYILGLLNSKLYYFWLYHRGKRKGDYLELYRTPLSEIPIKKATLLEKQSIIDLVDKILAAKKQEPQADTNEIEHEIDLLVYHLYCLTFDEVNLIDESVTEEEYTSAK